MSQMAKIYRYWQNLGKTKQNKNMKDLLKTILMEALLTPEGKLDEITEKEMKQILSGYLGCVLFTEEYNLEREFHRFNETQKEALFHGQDFQTWLSDSITDDMRLAAYMDIKKFMVDAGEEALREAIEEEGLQRLGMDIWYSRNGHGAGFFDHSYEQETEDKLTAAAKALGEEFVYIGDDGVLRFGY
jgi:hypothetical protein